MIGNKHLAISHAKGHSYESLKMFLPNCRLCNVAPASSITMMSSVVRSGRFTASRYSFNRDSLEVVLCNANQQLNDSTTRQESHETTIVPFWWSHLIRIWPGVTIVPSVLSILVLIWSSIGNTGPDWRKRGVCPPYDAVRIPWSRP
jgi:hypothetical protein